MVNELFQSFSEVMAYVGALFVNMFETAVSVVYNSTDGVTDIGYLFIIGAVTTLFYFALRWIRSLIKLRG